MTVRECPQCGRLAVACPAPCEAKATARRIAAALYAVQDLPTAALESGAVRQALTAAREGLEAGDTRREVEADTRLVAALDALGMAPVAPEDWLKPKKTGPGTSPEGSLVASEQDDAAGSSGAEG